MGQVFPSVQKINCVTFGERSVFKRVRLPWPFSKSLSDVKRQDHGASHGLRHPRSKVRLLHSPCPSLMMTALPGAVSYCASTWAGPRATPLSSGTRPEDSTTRGAKVRTLPVTHLSSQVSAGEPQYLLEGHYVFLAWWGTFLVSHRLTFVDHKCFLTQFCVTDVDAMSTHISNLVQIVTLQQVPKHTMLKTDLSVFALLFQISLSTADGTALARCWTRQLCTRLHRVPMFFKHISCAMV